MLECSNAQEYFSAYLDDELPPEQREFVQEHLAVCPACRQELAHLTRLWEALEALPEVPPPAGLIDQVMARLPRRKTPWWGSLALAASLLVGILLGGSLGVDLHEELRQPALETQVVALEAFEDFPPASLGTLVATYRFDEENGA
jgi:anti-sigma factor RsiW